jgi:hypothetical protein
VSFVEHAVERHARLERVQRAVQFRERGDEPQRALRPRNLHHRSQIARLRELADRGRRAATGKRREEIRGVAGAELGWLELREDRVAGIRRVDRDVRIDALEVRDQHLPGGLIEDVRGERDRDGVALRRGRARANADRKECGGCDHGRETLMPA